MAEPVVFLFGIPITNCSVDAAVERILVCLEKPELHTIFFVNAHCVNLSRGDMDYYTILNRATFVFGDGAGMRLAGAVLGQPLVENVNGTDLYPRLCERLRGRGTRLFLLGAAPGVAERMKAEAERHYPGIQIAGTQHGFFNPEENESVVQAIRASHAELLLVAMGVPAQEQWIATHAARTGVRVALGVGGLFNFYSGKIPRAPLGMRRMGLEWLHRLWMEPRRLWRRYLVGNMQFLITLLWEKISHR